MKNITKVLVFAVISSAQFFSSILLTYIVITVLLYHFKLFESYIDRVVLRIFYLRVTVTLALMVGMTGWYLAQKQKFISKISPSNLFRSQRLLFFLISLLLAAFYIDPFPKDNQILFYSAYSILTALFYILIPQLLNFYHQWNFLGLRYWKDYTQEWQPFRIKRRLVILVGSMLIVSVGIYLIFVTVFRYIKGEIAKENQLRHSTYITEVLPARTTNAERVNLVGYNLGWGNTDDKRYALWVGGEKINQIEIWQDSIIIFTLPLQLQPGPTKVWISIPRDSSQPKTPIIKSNKMDLEIVPRLEYLPAEYDDTQTKLWKKVTTKLQRISSTIKKILYEE